MTSQLSSRQKQLIQDFLKEAREFDERFWKEQREFEERWAKQKQNPPQ
jgi:hypothetical protein